MKFVVDDIARMTFPKSLRGYSEEDVNDFMKKIRADYRDYNLQLEEKDKELDEQEKCFLDQHKERRREFDASLQELSKRLKLNKAEIARLEVEARGHSSSLAAQVRLDELLSKLDQCQRDNEGLRLENADYQAQLEKFKERVSSSSRLPWLERELEATRQENQALRLREKLGQQENELAELRQTLEQIQTVKAAEARPVEITTILSNVRSLADSVLQDAERKKARILAETQQAVALTRQEAEKQKSLIYQQAELEQTEVRRAFEKERSQASTDLSLVNERVKEKESELAETESQLQALNAQLAELSQSKEASQADLVRVREQTERLRQQLLDQFTVVIQTLKNKGVKGDA